TRGTEEERIVVERKPTKKLKMEPSWTPAELIDEAEERRRR
ncbi:hypothetical protein A2U01_0075268, partial [Trifolium medium]|nr:hypothetical protein [Trifolium medium]